MELCKILREGDTMKPGDLVFPFPDECMKTVGIYLSEYKAWNYEIECKIFWNGHVTVLPKHQLKLARAS